MPAVEHCVGVRYESIRDENVPVAEKEDPAFFCRRLVENAVIRASEIEEWP